jgi:hypothetical protein
LQLSSSQLIDAQASKLEARVGIERGSFADCQPQCPDLQGDFNTGFTGVQAVFGTTHHLPALTRHLLAAYSVIEEIVEGFVEDFSLLNLVSSLVVLGEMFLIYSEPMVHTL